MLNSKIFLVGLPGAGKTTFGMRLAREISYRFFDMDQVIEEKYKMPVRQIFQEKGEQFFRDAERTALHELAALKEKTIIATGGGTPCFHGNMEFMIEQGVTIFLDESLEVIEKRLSGKEVSQRPLFNAKDNISPREILDKLYLERQNYYSMAKIILKDDAISPEGIIPKLNLEV